MPPGNYDEESRVDQKRIEDAETEAYGRTCGPMLEDSGGESDSEAEEEEEDGEEGSESESYDEEENDAREWDFEQDSEGNLVRVPDREKTEEEIRAEKQLAQCLGLAYPRQFYDTRKQLAYIYHAACQGRTTEDGVRLALQSLKLDQRLTETDLEFCIEFAVKLSGDVVVPEQEVADAFAPYSTFKGGYYTKTSQHVVLLLAVALAAHMTSVLPEYRERGSAQEQYLRGLLKNKSAIFGDALYVLVQEHATDTPRDSTKAEVLSIAKQLNELEPHDRLVSLYANITGFAELVKERAKKKRGDGGHVSTSAYDYGKFDHTRPKSAGDTAEKNGVALVSLTLAFRKNKDDKQTAKLKEVYGEDALPSNRNYVRMGPGYVATHRAQTYVPAGHGSEGITPRNIVRAADQIVVNENLAPKMNAFIDSAYTGPDCDPEAPIGFAVDNEHAYLSLKIDGKPVRIGKERPRSRFVTKQNDLHLTLMNGVQEGRYAAVSKEGRPQPMTWLWLGCNLRAEHIASLLCPPWKGYNVGTFDFCMLLTDKAPPGTMDPSNISNHVYPLIKYPNAVGVYPPRFYRNNSPTPGVTKQDIYRSRLKHKGEVERAKIYLESIKKHASVVTAEPGGSDALSAEASFDAQVASLDAPVTEEGGSS